MRDIRLDRRARLNCEWPLGVSVVGEDGPCESYVAQSRIGESSTGGVVWFTAHELRDGRLSRQIDEGRWMDASPSDDAVADALAPDLPLSGSLPMQDNHIVSPRSTRRCMEDLSS